MIVVDAVGRWARTSHRLTRILTRFRSPLLISPNTDMTRSWASFAGSMGPPTSGTHNGDAVVLEEREREPVLVAVECPVRLADDHGVKLTVLVLQFSEQRASLRSPPPREGP